MSAFNQVDQRQDHSQYKELRCYSKESAMSPNIKGVWNCPLA